MRWIAFVIAAVVIFTVFVSVYAASAKRAEVRLLPKWLWVLLCVLLPPIGGLLYLVVGRPIGSSSAGPRTSRRTRTVAPDDDPEFLRDLAEKLKQDEPTAEPTAEPAAEPTAEPADKADSSAEKPEGNPDDKPDEEPKPKG